MPKLRRISGKNLIKILLAEDFLQVRQIGSHVRLVKKISETSHYITVPLHDELDRGTLKSIIRSLYRCFDSDKIKKLFYTK